MLGFGALVALSQRDKVDVSSVDTNKILAATDDSGNIADHVDGNKDAKVRLIEYGDFQCPGCGGAHPIVKSLTEKYGENMAFVFRNFPLTGIHPNARAAAAAVESAGIMGKYWQMHNLVFESQDEWSDASSQDRTAIFKRYAKEIGLDEAKFDQNLRDASDQINKKIAYDQSLGRKIKVSATPTFYLNGTLMTQEQTSSQEVFEKAITDELKKQGVSVETTPAQ